MPYSDQSNNQTELFIERPEQLQHVQCLLDSTRSNNSPFLIVGYFNTRLEQTEFIPNTCKLKRKNNAIEELRTKPRLSHILVKFDLLSLLLVLVTSINASP